MAMADAADNANELNCFVWRDGDLEMISSALLTDTVGDLMTHAAVTCSDTVYRPLSIRIHLQSCAPASPAPVPQKPKPVPQRGSLDTAAKPANRRARVTRAATAHASTPTALALLEILQEVAGGRDESAMKSGVCRSLDLDSCRSGHAKVRSA